MIHPMLQNSGNRLRSLLLLVTLALLASVARADGGGTTAGGGAPGNSNSVSTGDEVVSLPVLADPSGLTLVGQREHLRALVLAVEGDGTAFLQRLGRGRVAVTWMGNFRIQLDRRALARGEVDFLFRGGRLFDGGLALLSIAGGDPRFVPSERIPMPASRLAGSGFEGLGLELAVRAMGGQSARGSAAFRGGRVVWTQRFAR
jgi:hypothetical protein